MYSYFADILDTCKAFLTSGGPIQLQCASFWAPFHNSNKKPQPYKTEAATKNFSST